MNSAFKFKVAKNFSVVAMEISEDEHFHSVSFYADRMGMDCVWQEDSKVNMEEINQMLESIDAENANDHFEQQTPSDLSGIISASFSSDSSALDESKTEDENETKEFSFTSSTPFVCIHDSHAATKRRRQEAFKYFTNASPILASPRATREAKSNSLIRKRLDFDLDDTDEFVQKMKLMKI